MLLPLLALLAPPLAGTDLCDSFIQQDMNRCAFERFGRADAQLAIELSKTLAWAEDSRIRAVLIPGAATFDDRSFATVLRASQDAWVKYRDAECDVRIYGNHGGSIVAMVHFTCLAELTEERIKTLRACRDSHGQSCGRPVEPDAEGTE